ncbi:hypothetical protein [Notoacmeibacter sp. MSK16QG-6]|uniref:hypothetical protein n=1 Tax=Notoacmeibacter sp. MSK16QG-6 TaxID=2957982 RepID=UPI0020A00546|nr:hypothetical protein [Notoacmeibacter sp. MSK16QG-6]MCP1199835.1 hypothetical protein [Notoacmeibacter sp. MSK16QG-6]
MKLSIYLMLIMAGTGSVAPDLAMAVRCKDYANCRQAVENWCAGLHPRADGDNDGIPCENVCSSREQVERIMAEIGCRR